MKKVLALLLCCGMLLTIAAGCKKNQQKELSDARISSDVANSSHLYAYDHVAGDRTVHELNITQRTEEGDRVSLKATADVHFSNAIVAVKAEMAYRYVDANWKLEDIAITSSDVELTAAPDTASVMMELTNYASIVGSVYAVYDETYQPLYFNLADATTKMSYEAGADTAKLELSLVSDKLSFTGTYTLTFGENGWQFETVKQTDNRNHPLLRLTSLEKKDSK